MTIVSRYQIAVTLKTPASFSDSPAMGNDNQTLSYIPGSSLRGMLASLYLAKHATVQSGKSSPDHTFRRLFVDGAVQFPNLYPESSRRLPLSAYSCKYHAGFRKDKLPSFMIPSHCVVDRLWDDFFPKPSKDCENTSCKLPQRDCMELNCHHPLTQLEKAFYSGTDSFQSIEPFQMMRMSTAVHGNSGSARQGTLHSQQELAANQVFRGYLVACEQDFLLLKSLLGVEFDGYLGRRRAGSANVALDEYGSGWEQAEIYKSQDRPEVSYVAMTCITDLILVDELLCPVISLSTKNLPGLLTPPVEIQVNKAFTSSRMVAGWLAVGKLYKENDLAITAGSTFLLQFSSQEEDRMVEWMKDIQMRGIGLRRSEGFGQVTFGEPLHKASWLKLERYLNNPTTEDFRL